MKQSSLGLSNTVKRTRKREFLDAMELVVPWTELVSLIEPYAPEAGRRGQQPFAVQTLLRITLCSNGSSSAIPPWKKRCTTCQPFGTLRA